MTTTVHIPEDLLREIDTAAQARGVSRNRFVLQACREALEKDGGSWPDGFFEPQLSDDDRSLLEEATRELEHEVRLRRRNRGAVPL